MFLQPTHVGSAAKAVGLCPSHALHMQNQSKQFGVSTTSGRISSCFEMGGGKFQSMFCCFSCIRGCALKWGPGVPTDFVLVKVDLGHTGLMVRAVQLRE